MPKTFSVIDLAEYAPVADRLTLFHSKYPNGRVITDLVSRRDGEITFKARVYRRLEDRVPSATGWASEKVGDGEVNKAACLENTETSAVGRALANLGFLASSNRPSREEMEKVNRSRQPMPSLGSRRSTEKLKIEQSANSAHDILDLISSAELIGMSAKRAEIFRSSALQLPPLPNRRIRKIEASLRSWIRRHEM